MDPTKPPYSQRPRGRGRGAGAVNTSLVPETFPSHNIPQSAFAKGPLFPFGGGDGREFPTSLAIASRPFGLGGGRGTLISKSIVFASSSDSDDGNVPNTSRKRQDTVPDPDDFTAKFGNLSTTGFQPAHPSRGRGRGNGAEVPDSSISERHFRHPTQVPGRMPPRPPIASVALGLGLSTSSTPASCSSKYKIRSVRCGRLEEDFAELQQAVVIKRGEKGESVSLCANYMRLKVLQQCGLFEYHVVFDPFIESTKIRKDVIYQSCGDHLGSTLNFDGGKLYLPFQLATNITEFSLAHPSDPGCILRIKVKLVKQNSLEDCTHFYNVLLRRIMDKLGYIQLQRNFYDYKNVIEMPIHKLEIWPGFVTAVDVYEGGLMLNCDANFRVLRTDTLLDTLYRLQGADESGDARIFNKRYLSAVLNKIVLTKYNTKHYRIDDVDWNLTPESTFPVIRSGQQMQVSFVDYYRTQYGIEIKDRSQPMLITRAKPKKRTHVDDAAPGIIALVPELCYVTGITEEITSNYTTMKAMAENTRISPVQRSDQLLKFIENVNGRPEIRNIFSDWGLELESGLVSLKGRVLKPPPITVHGREIIPQPGDFNKDLMRSHILEPVPIGDYLVVCSSQDYHKAKLLVDTYAQIAPPLGMRYLSHPRIECVARPTPNEFRKILNNCIKLDEPQKTQFVVAIINGNRDDLYSTVKQVCTKEKPIPSQVILSKTLQSQTKLRSIMQKVALQINCKLGGGLWTIRIPLPERIMFMGMDVYHDEKYRPSVTAVVASINPTFTKYYTRVIFQSHGQEIINSLRPVFEEALQTFYEENRAFPDRVIMFRDGVGDGQLEVTRANEVSQMEDVFQQYDIQPKFTFCVVQKRINTRLFLETERSNRVNPKPGTVMDHTITRRYLYDFFLVSQLIREGTVTPTHYIVLFDNAQTTPDLMQKFAYATSYMYYNWAGSIRVPAMCQYAHKAASLVGKHVRSEPSRSMAKQLYYL